MTEEREGGCQCGLVRYRVVGAPLMINVCHCRECQRQSGSAFGMSMIVPQSNFVAHGPLRVFTRGTESGRTLSCYFCAECGTRIYHVPSYAQGVVNIKPGTLDDPSWIRPGGHFWTRSRQPWLELPGDVPHHESQP